MKILNCFPSYCKGISVITVTIGILLLFSVFGSHVFGLDSIDIGITFILVSFLLFILSKDRRGVDATAKKIRALVYAIVINTSLLIIASVVVASSNSVFTGIIPLYANTFSVFVIYLIIYFNPWCISKNKA